MSVRRFTWNAGFSLVEMLVVLAILGIAVAQRHLPVAPE